MQSLIIHFWSDKNVEDWNFFVFVGFFAFTHMQYMGSIPIVRERKGTIENLMLVWIIDI